jgi:hypothetical protein
LGAFEITKIRLQKMLTHFGFDAQCLMTGVDEKIKTLRSQKRNKRPITIGSDDEGEVNAEQDACDMLLAPSPLDPRTEETFSRLKKGGRSAKPNPTSDEERSSATTFVIVEMDSFRTLRAKKI